MTLATDSLRLFTEGWAEYLADQVDGLTWEPEDPYTADQVGIWLMSLPTLPAFDNSSAVALTPYPLADDATFADSTVGLQVKVRRPGQDPRPVWQLDDEIANAVLGNWPLDLPGGVHVSTVLGRTSSSLGIDAKQRLTWQSSYPCRVLRPGAHRS